VRRERVLPALGLAITTFVFIFSLTFFQGTGPTAGPRLQGRLAAAAVELDRWLPAHREDIEASARERPRLAIELTELPVSVTVPTTAVLDQDPSRLQAAIVAAMGEVLYADGRPAFFGGGSLSVTEPARWLMDFIRPSVHRFWEYLALFELAGIVLLATVAAISTTAPPLSAILRPVAFGAGFALLASVVLWLAGRAGAAAAGPPITDESFLIVRDFAALGIRISLALCLGAGAILMLRNITNSDGARPSPLDRRTGAIV
jgi:hypothetical protein